MTSPLPTDEDREALWKLIHRLMALGQVHTPQEVADAILAAGFRRSVVSTPSYEVRQAIHELEREIPDAYSEGRGEPCIVLTERAARVALSVLEASAVSAPPTITDEALLAAFEEHYLVDDADLFYDRSKLLDGLRAVAALGGEGKTQ